MKSLWITKIFPYDGTQLRPLFAYLSEGLLGDSIVSWRGPCQIDWVNMVDGEDLRAQSPIAGSDMVHFIVEKFDCSLFAAVGLQRLITAIALELIRDLAKEGSLALQVFRVGDDLFCGERKLSISVATLSLRSALIHFALNVSNEGTPVPTLSLTDLGIDPEQFSRILLDRVVEEVHSVIEATCKVRTV